MKKLGLLSVVSLLVGLSSCQNALNFEESGPINPGITESRSIGAGSPEVNYNSDFKQVRLVYAQPFNYAVSGMTYNASYIHVHVKNLGTPGSRQVVVHYTTGGAWQDQVMNLGGTYNQHSLYNVTIPSNTIRFAVKFQSDAGTWWDNNRGSDYWITPWVANGNYKPGVVGGGIALLNAKTVRVTFGGGASGWRIKGQMAIDTSVFPGAVSGGIRIKDPAYGANYWSDFFHFNYNYSPTSAPNIKIYDFESDPVSYNINSGSMEYVIFAYKNLGFPSTCHIYWDNNFNMNYIQAKSDGATIY